MSAPDQTGSVAQRAPGDPRRGGVFTRLARGGGSVGRGFRFVLEHPRLIPYCLLPLTIAATLFVVMVCLLWLHYGDLVNLIWAKPTSWVLRLLWYAIYLFIFLLVMLFAYASFFVMQALLAAPFYDLLSERVEELAFGRGPAPFSLGRLAGNAARALLHALARLAIYLAIMVTMLLLSLVLPVIGSPLMLVGGSLLTAFYLGWDTQEYAMDRRAWSFRRKWQFLHEHRALVLGAGGALEAALLIPVLGLLCLPMGAVGGTLLFGDLELTAASEPSPQPSVV